MVKRLQNRHYIIFENDPSIFTVYEIPLKTESHIITKYNLINTIFQFFVIFIFLNHEHLIKFTAFC